MMCRVDVGTIEIGSGFHAERENGMRIFAHACMHALVEPLRLENITFIISIHTF